MGERLLSSTPHKKKSQRERERERERAERAGEQYRGWAKRSGEDEAGAIITLEKLYSGITRQIMGITAGSEVWNQPEESSESDAEARGSESATCVGTCIKQWGSESSGSGDVAIGAAEDEETRLTNTHRRHGGEAVLGENGTDQNANENGEFEPDLRTYIAPFWCRRPSLSCRVVV